MSAPQESPTTYTCKTCSFICASRRMLSAHKASAHPGKVYKCPLCPFVSCYQANVYRHRRTTHKIDTSTCNICGLQCRNLDELTNHKEIEHNQGLEAALERYEKDKLEEREGYESRIQLERAQALYFSGFGYDALEKQKTLEGQGSTDNSWLDYEENEHPGELPEEPVFYSIRNGTGIELLEAGSEASNQSEPGTAPKMELSPLKIKRHYQCKDCGFETLKPKDFLCHRRDVHRERIFVQECPYCIYATRHFQKLQRHCGLIHKDKPIPQTRVEASTSTPADPPPKTARKSVPSQQKVIPGASIRRARTPPSAAESKPAKLSRMIKVEQRPSPAPQKPKPAENVHQYKCSRCDFITKSKITLTQHEKTVHLRRKFFRCLECGYITNERGRYTKHVKYHSLPKIKCEQCDFFTAYKWNLDRHMKNHEMDGPYSCNKCSFSANNSLSLKTHLTNHHINQNNGEVGNCDDDEEDEEQLMIDENEEEEEEEGAVEDNEAEETEISGDEENEDFDDGEIEINEDEIVINDEEEEEDIDMAEEFEQPEDEEDLEEQFESQGYSDEESEVVELESHQCRFCDFQASSPEAITAHEESHGTSKRYPCPLCGVSFDHVAWLARHLTQKHNEATTSKDISRAAKLMKKENKVQVPVKEISKPPVPSAILKSLPAGTTLRPINVPAPKPVPVPLSRPQSTPQPQSSTRDSRAVKTFPSQKVPLQPAKAQPPISTPRAKKSFSRKRVEESPKPIKVESPPPKVPKIESPPPRELRPEDIFKTSLIANRITHTCKICDYRTRWNSEIEKHCRVHSSERPFHCPSCKYRCKWKGDLKRHVVKYHDESLLEIVEKMKTPPLGKLSSLVDYQTTTSPHKDEPETVTKPATQASSVRKGSLKIRLRTVSGRKSIPSDSEAVTPGRSILKPLRLRSSTTQQESPLDLTITKRPTRSSVSYQDDSEDTDLYIDQSSRSPENETYRYEQPNVVYHPQSTKRKADMMMTRRRSSEESGLSPVKKMRTSIASTESAAPKTVVQKYKCTFCPFMAKTASRFHVHIVQHLNKKPFMCSTCFYKSNWEWDITKHIKIKSVRDETHRSATMMVTDESGRKNYEKYNRFLVNIESNTPGDGDDDDNQADGYFDNASQGEEEEEEEETNNFSISLDDVETIVVTPDFEGVSKNVENTENSVTLDLQHYLNSPEKSYSSTNLFYCKHCSFKHSDKNAVVGHLSMHAGRKPYQCKICGMTSNWKHVVLRHVKMRHAGDITQVTNLLNYVLDGNVVQLASLRDDEIQQDEHPNLSPSHNNELALSNEIKMPAMGIQCIMCPYICEKQCYMQFHMKQHRPREEATFKCPHCDYWVNFKKSLTKHLKVHEEGYGGLEAIASSSSMGGKDSLLENLLLGFKSADVQELSPFSPPRSPAKDFVKLKKFQCEFCPYSTDNKRHFLYHKQFHRPNKTAPFKCSACSYWSNFKHLISQHLNKCHGLDSNQSVQYEPEVNSEEPIVVPFEDTTRRVTYLGSPVVGGNEIVMVTQGGKTIKMFKCRFCPMMNRRRANVKSHEDMHNSNRTTKFACPICNYQCNSQGVLTSHMKLHAMEESQEIVSSTPGEENGNPPTSTFVLPSPVTPRRKAFSYFCPNCPALFKSRSDFQTHFSFHASGLPFSCDKCDYQARHKPHLHKHFLVHSEEYQARRDKCQPKEISQFEEAEVIMEDDVTPTNNQVSSANQMLILEERETSMFLEKGFGKQTPKVNKCPTCPAAFQKSSILAFHKFLHGSVGKFSCDKCNYSVNDIKNLTTHQKLHPGKSSAPARTVLKIFACNKCPAVFTKSNRYHRHMELHGMKNKFTCEQCDFSVAFYVNLVKHKAVHQTVGAPPLLSAPMLSIEPLKEVELNVDKIPDAPPKLETQNQNRVNYSCPRCPYFHCRRDSLNKHSRRHKANQPFQCVHCDYSSIQASFLRDHMKWHFQSGRRLFKPQAFMKYSQLEIWSIDGDEKELMFRDKGEDKIESARFIASLSDEDEEGQLVIVEDRTDQEDLTRDDEAEKSEMDVTKQTCLNNIADKLMAKAIKESKNLEVVLTDLRDIDATKKQSDHVSPEKLTTKVQTKTSAVKSLSHTKALSTKAPSSSKLEKVSADSQQQTISDKGSPTGSTGIRIKTVRVCLEKINDNLVTSPKNARKQADDAKSNSERQDSIEGDGIEAANVSKTIDPDEETPGNDMTVADDAMEIDKPMADVTSETLLNVTSQTPVDLTAEQAAFLTDDVTSKLAVNINPGTTSELTPEKATDVTTEPPVEVSPETIAKATPEVAADLTTETHADPTPKKFTGVIPDNATEVISEQATDVIPEKTTDVTPEKVTDVNPKKSASEKATVAPESFETDNNEPAELFNPKSVSSEMATADKNGKNVISIDPEAINSKSPSVVAQQEIMEFEAISPANEMAETPFDRISPVSNDADTNIPALKQESPLGVVPETTELSQDVKEPQLEEPVPCAETLPLYEPELNIEASIEERLRDTEAYHKDSQPLDSELEAQTLPLVPELSIDSLPSPPSQDYEDISSNEEEVEHEEDHANNPDDETAFATQVLLAEAEEASQSKELTMESTVDLNAELSSNLEEGIVVDEAANNEVLQACLAITDGATDLAQGTNEGSIDDIVLEDGDIILDEIIDDVGVEEMMEEDEFVENEEEAQLQLESQGQAIEQDDEGECNFSLKTNTEEALTRKLEVNGAQDWSADEVQNDMLVDILVTAGVYEETP